MNGKQEVHPAPDTLAAYGLGKLGPAEADTVETHIAECKACCETLLDLKSDTFVDLVRRSDAVKLEPDIEESQAGYGTIAFPEPAQEIAFDLPESLTHHPRYRILELLGRGGMGDVYRAEHKLMDRPVALKLINRQLVDNSQAIERFRREVQAAAQLSHPNIVTAYDAEQAGDVHYLVMEHVEGTDLFEVVKQRGPLPTDVACDYVCQAATGLQHAHEKGMVHRDIKPQNLMVTPEGQVKILDFGLATLAVQAICDKDGGTSSDDKAEQNKSPRLTSIGALMGTPDYISPEQANDARSADIRSDIYSLGCTLYCLLTGRPPFPTGSTIEKLSDHIRCEPRPLAEYRDDVPAGVVEILMRMMAKDPVDRFQTPAEVAQALLPFSGGKAAELLAAERARRFLRKTTAIAASIVLLAAALGTVVYRISTDHGEVVLTSNDPNVEVAIRHGGEEIAILDTKTKTTVTLNTGDYTLALSGDAEGLKIDMPETFTLRRGKTVIVSVRRLTEKEQARLEQRKIIERPKELAALKTQLGGDLPNDPFDVRIVDLRERLVAFRLRHYGTPEAIEAARLMAQLPWPTDALKRDDIPGCELKAAGHGDSAKAPRELVSVLGDSRLRLWMGGVTAAFGPDGQTVFSGGWNGVVTEWDAKSGELKWTLSELTSYPAKFFFSRDRSRVAATTGGTLKLMDRTGGRTPLVVRADSHSIQSVAFSHDGKTIAVGGGDRSIKLITWNTGNVFQTLRGHAGEVRSVAFSPDGTTLASSGSDGAIKVWTLEGQEQLSIREHAGRVFQVAFSPDGRSLASASEDGTVRVWDIKTGKRVHRLQGHAKGVLSVAYSPDGQTIASGGMDRVVKLWNASTGDQQGSLSTSDWVWSVDFSPDGTQLVATDEQSLALWDIASGKRVHTDNGHIGRVASATVAPDGQGVASAGYDGTIRLWSLGTPKAKWTFAPYKETRLHSVAFSVDGQTLAAGDGDNEIVFLDAQTGSRRKTIPGSRYPERGLTYSPDGTLAASGGEQQIILWNAATGKPEHILRGGHTHHVWSVDFHPDGRLLASASARGVINLWDVAKSQVRNTMEAGPKPITCVAFSPDGLILASIGWDHKLRLWDVATGRLVRAITGHQTSRFNPNHWTEVGSVCFSPGGSRLASSAFDGTVRVWNPQTGTELRSFRLCSVGGRIRQVAFTPDGRHLVTANGNGTIYVLRLAKRVHEKTSPRSNESTTRK